ncbi:MAG TPA: HIT family protein [Candidatus Binataceae bacterium]|nr:HIT family protein [Candidatus Binataceae bacterium]
MSTDARCGICALIERIGAGGFADFIAELPNCCVILGDAQFYRGYCLMLAKRHATEIFLMPPAEARALFEELRLVAEAIAAVTKPWKMNYECLGNAEPHVHWHLFPRYESDELRRAPIWIRQEAERKIALPEADRIALIATLRREIAARIPDARCPAN